MLADETERRKELHHARHRRPTTFGRIAELPVVAAVVVGDRDLLARSVHVRAAVRVHEALPAQVTITELVRVVILLGAREVLDELIEDAGERDRRRCDDEKTCEAGAPEHVRHPDVATLRFVDGRFELQFATHEIAHADIQRSQTPAGDAETGHFHQRPEHER